MRSRQWSTKKIIRYSGIAALTIGLLGACNQETPALRPPGEAEDFLRAADVLVAAQCELDRAMSSTGDAFPSAKAEIAMTLTVQVSKATGGGVTLVIPIAATDLTIRRDRVPEGAAIRKMDFRVTHTFGAAPDCPTAEAPTTPEGVRFIEGGLGLAEWVAEAGTLTERAGQTPHEINYALSFDIAVSNDRTPIFSRPIDDVDGSLTRNDTSAREVRHRIAVTMIPDKAGGKAADTARRDAADRFLDRIGG